MLVFPKITKAGLGIGGQFGEGALIKGGKTVAYYNTTGISSGLQAGAQQYGYAMFFMNDAALKQLDKTEGFEVGVGPTIVVMDEGKAKSTTTTSAKDDIYAFIFSQKGLMAGLGLQGNKITKISSQIGEADRSVGVTRLRSICRMDRVPRCLAVRLYRDPRPDEVATNTCPSSILTSNRSVASAGNSINRPLMMS